MGNAFQIDCCVGRQEWHDPNATPGQVYRTVDDKSVVHEFSFAQGGWIEREAFSAANLIRELRLHPGQFRELYFTKDMPLLTNGPRELKADCGRLTTSEAQSLAHILRSDRGLRVLLLQNIKLSDTAVAHLFSALKGPRAAGLQSLSLLSMDLIGELELAIADMLRTSSWVQNLSLSGSSFSIQGAASVASALRFNTNLEKLDLENANFLDAGASALAGALISNPKLTSLTLRGNGISDTGAIAIAGTLRVNRCLLQLDLHSNGIADAGANAIAIALRSNCTLERLDLRSNILTAEDKAMLEEASRCNKGSSMKKLMLWDNASEIFQQADLEPGPFLREDSVMDSDNGRSLDTRNGLDAPSPTPPKAPTPPTPPTPTPKSLTRCPPTLGSPPASAMGSMPMLASQGDSLPSFGSPRAYPEQSRVNWSRAPIQYGEMSCASSPPTSARGPAPPAAVYGSFKIV